VLFYPLSAKKSKSESDLMVSHSDSTRMCFHDVHARHLALKDANVYKLKCTPSDCFFGNFDHWVTSR